MKTPTNAKPQTNTPPVARRDPKETSIHGHPLVDDYAWLRDKSSPEVIAYLEAENAYSAALMKETETLQQDIYQEMLSHIMETDVSVPFPDRGYLYYTRTEQGLQYPIHCRKPRRPDENAGEQIVLDVNELAEKEDFMAVGALTVSDDGTLLAYSTDTTGFRQYTLHVKNLNTGEILSEQVQRAGSVVWAADSRTLFYTVEDEEQKRQFQFYRHIVGTPHEQDVLVCEEKDERFNLGAGRTRDGKYLILASGSHTACEEQFLSAATPAGTWTLIHPREDDLEYYADHRNGSFYIRTNDAGRNFRLVATPVGKPGRANWTELLPHRADVMLEEVELFSTFQTRWERSDGLARLRVLSFVGAATTTGTAKDVNFPEPAYNALPSNNREFETDKYRYSYQSLVTPGSVYEFDVVSGTSTLLKQQEVPGGFDRSLYKSERILAQTADGVRVPVSIVYRRDKKGEGTNPLWIYGYGSYGYSIPIGFNPSRLTMLDRGFVLAYAHIRGGGDMGKPWHDAGRLMQKRNTFTDFIAATEDLIARGYGDPARVAIEGGSAGGLLMGAVANMRPDLFRAVVSHVPFVDVMNTMLDASLPLTVPEYEEWGNPNEQTAFEYMLTYSPYDNLRRGDYPAMLVKTSLNDSQVMYWEPAKYIAKLRALNTGSRALMLYTNMSAGHGGASGRYDYLKEIAFDYAFLLRELGVE